MAYSMTLIASEYSAAVEAKRQIHELLEDLLDITIRAYDQLGEAGPIKDDLVLITAPPFEEVIRPHLTPEPPTLWGGAA